MRRETSTPCWNQGGRTSIVCERSSPNGGATRPDGSPIPVEAIADGKTIHLATPHGALDLLAERAAPLSFAELMGRADTRRVDGVEAPICSLGDLVALKRIASRERDLADPSELEAAYGELPDSRHDQ